MNKYEKELIREDGRFDVYDILEAYQVRCPAIQHAIKKLLMPGMRGSKVTLDDLVEARLSVVRAIELEELRDKIERG